MWLKSGSNLMQRSQIGLKNTGVEDLLEKLFIAMNIISNTIFIECKKYTNQNHDSKRRIKQIFVNFCWQNICVRIERMRGDSLVWEFGLRIYVCPKIVQDLNFACCKFGSTSIYRKSGSECFHSAMDFCGDTMLGMGALGEAVDFVVENWIELTCWIETNLQMMLHDVVKMLAVAQLWNYWIVIIHLGQWHFDLWKFI